jgi:hypothetical protein
MDMSPSRIRRSLLGLWIVQLSLVMTSPASAERDTGRNDDGQTPANSNLERHDALKSLLQGFRPYGPAGTPLPAGAKQVDLNQFLDLLIGGAVPFAPRDSRDHEHQHASWDDEGRRPDPDDNPLPGEDALHERVVKAFLLEQPQLTQLARLVNAEPIPGHGATRNGDGTWSIHPAGVSHPVETLGRSAKLSWIYNSILFSRSRQAQLDLYTSVYAKLPRGSVGTTTGQFPTPASLVDANLATINNALQLIGRNWASIVNQIAPKLPIQLMGCDAEIGASPRSANYGDRTGSPPSCGPIAGGLYSKINFTNKTYPTCVKDQGGRGTCHSFANTSAVEEAISLNHGIKVNLSEQDLMEHYRFVWNRAVYNDLGDPWEEINGALGSNYFFPYENHWDYNPAYGRDTSTTPFTHSCDNVAGEPCSDTSPQPPAACGEFLGSLWCMLYEAGIHGSSHQPTTVGYFWNSADTELSVEYMILQLAFNNAVVVALTVSPAFEAPSSGFVTYDPADLAKTPLGGHVVHIVSFVSNQDLQTVMPNAPPGSGGGYFVVKNSWGSCFSDGGYIYLPWDYMKAEVGEAYAISGAN